jgi:antitoxin component YwqK of YwqJK toxin-antitoxin module
MKSKLNNEALRHTELDQVGSDRPTKLLRHYVSSENEVRMEGYIKTRRFLPHGDLAITNSDGRRILLGQYVNGKADGNWIRWYDNGKVFSEYTYSLGCLLGRVSNTGQTGN